MPIYEYQCDECGLRAEKLWGRISLAQDTIPCTECKTEMRKLVSATNFKFSHPQSQLRGAAPPSTGTSDDWNFDRVIGRDAEQKWEAINKRNAEKDRVIRHERENGLELKRNQLVLDKDGYRPIKENERVRANEGREVAAELNKALTDQIKKERKKKKPETSNS